MAELRLRIDPSAMVSGAAQAERSLDAVADQAVRTESATDRLGKGFTNVGAKAATAGTNAQSLGARFSAMGPKIQQSAFQVGDFAVQVGNGTAATTALSQQLPQLLGAFGALGAVAGAAVAILVPLGAALFSAGGASRTLEEHLDDLSDALERSKEASDLARGGMAGLREEFGSAGRGAQDLARAFADISLRNLVDEANGAVTALNDLYDGNPWLNESRAEQMGQAFGFGTQGTRAIAADWDAVGAAETLGEKLERVVHLREHFLALAGPVADMDAEQLETYTAIVETQRALEQVTAQVADASRDIDFATARDNAADMASEVERALAALDSMASASRSSLQGERLRSQFSNDPVGLAGALKGAEFDRNMGGATTDPLLAQALSEQRAALVAEAETAAQIRKTREDAAAAARKAEQEAAAAARKGQSAATAAMREAEREADRQAKALERQRDAYDGLISRLDPATGAAMRFAEAQETINEALAQGYISASEAAKATDLAREEMDKSLESLDEAAGLWGDVKNAAGAAFTGIITGTQSAGDAIGNMLTKISTMLLNRTFDTIFDEIIGDGKSGGSGIVGTLINAALGAGASAASGASYSADTAAANRAAFDVLPFANGGAFLGGSEIVDRPTIFPMAGGRRGMMGEAGPEAIMPLEVGRGGKLGVRATGGGGGQTVSVNVSVDARGAQMGAAEQIRKEMDRWASGPGLIRAVHSAVGRGIK